MSNMPNINWTLLMSAAGLNTVTSPDSKEPESIQMRIVSNHLAMEYLQAPPKDQLQCLSQFRTPLLQLLTQLEQLDSELVAEELRLKKSLDETCQTAETI